jgi:excinuclease ABC subunit C
VTVIGDAARSAPAAAGVYLFFGPGRSLLYVGKASKLRRRLAQHARPRGGRLTVAYPLVGEIAWEAAADDDAAAAREADLILALQPAFNASLADDARWTFVVAAEQDAVRLKLARSPDGRGRAYGVFPHLGTRRGPRRAVARPSAPRAGGRSPRRSSGLAAARAATRSGAPRPRGAATRPRVPARC